MEKKDITSLLHILTLTPIESSSTQISIHELQLDFNVCRRSLIGLFLTNENIIVEGLIFMTKAGSCSNFSVICLSKNRYQFIFENADDPDRIQSEGPWRIDNHLLILKPWIEGWETDENFFDFSDFWVHVVGLPVHFYSLSIGRRIAGSFNGSTVLELRKEIESGVKFFRLRISINVNDPVRRVVRLALEGNGVEVGLLQYEKLPHICSSCGHMDHTLKHCNKHVMINSGKLETSKLPYGPCLQQTGAPNYC